METTIKPIEVQKELMAKKVEANFSHYTAGNLYYTVGLVDSAPMGTYQFPVSTIESGTITEMYGKLYTGNGIVGSFNEVDKLYSESEVKLVEEGKGSVVGIQVHVSKLSSDLGTTTFSSKMKGSELNRWIKKAIEKGDFVRVA